MIGLWIAVGLLTLGTIAAVAWPLLRRGAETADRAEYDLQVYRDQLAEIERDRTRGVISGDEAEAARAEIGRRMLALAPGEGADATQQPSGRPRLAKVWSIALALLIPVAAGGLYLTSGSPDLPGQPLASRDIPVDDRAERVALLSQAVARDPRDIGAWVALGETLRQQGRYREALEPFRQAMALGEGDPRFTTAYAETLVAANEGIVVERAIVLFEALMVRDPANQASHYYLALADYQKGAYQAAYDRWRDLLAGAPPTAAWVPQVRAQLLMVAAELGIPEAEALPPPPPVPAGPTDQDVAAAEAMSPEERLEMIRSMVDGLAARLLEAPGDVDGWLRLAQSYQVLGEPEKRRDALAAAAENGPDRVDALLAYADFLVRNPADPAQPGIPVEVLSLMTRIHELDADRPEALWFLGLDAAQSGDVPRARELWSRLLALMQPGTQEHALVEQQLQGLPPKVE